MKVNYEKTISVNNQVKVVEQKDDIKDLKEQCNKDDKDKDQEILGAGTPMKKNKSVYVTSSENL